jgi:16S rRNA (uracil1498-N3)-methyltransferase
MTRRRFYAPASVFSEDRSTLKLGWEEARHLRDVLRLREGDEVFVFDGEGHEFQCAVAESARDFALLKVVAETEPAKPESHLDLTLAIALLKGEKFDLVVQKATELGVKKIIPVASERADVHFREMKDSSKRLARWQRIAVEAAKQSGRACVPDVSEVVTFDSLVTDESSARFMFSERDGQPLAEAIHDQNSAQSVLALVGSEGGWSDEEIDKAKKAGWKIITLGGRILRAETAAIAVVTLLQNLLGDLK